MARGMRMAAAALVALFPAPGTVAGEMVRLPGITLRMPDDWRAVDAPAGGWGEGIAGVWILERDGGALANLVVGSAPGRMPVGEAAAGFARREIERCVRARGAMDEFEVLEMGSSPIDGLPAYRVVSRSTRGGARLGHVQRIIAASEAVVLTFTAPADTFAGLEPDFDAVACAAVAVARPTLLGEAPPWLCFAALGVIAGVSARTRRQLARAQGNAGAATPAS